MRSSETTLKITLATGQTQIRQARAGVDSGSDRGRSIQPVSLLKASCLRFRSLTY